MRSAAHVVVAAIGSQAAASPVQLASLAHRPGDLAVVGSDVYFIDREPNDESDSIEPPLPTVLNVIAHGTSTAIYAAQRPYPDRIVECTLAVDATTVYLSDPMATTILAIPRGGSHATAIAVGYAAITSMVVSAGALYVADADRGLRKISTRDHTDHAFGPSGLDLGELVISGDTLFAAAAGALYAIPLRGGPTVVVAEHQSASAIAADDRFLYWAIERSVYRAPRTGGGPVELVVVLPAPTPSEFYTRFNVAMPDVPIRALAADRDVVYVAAWFPQHIGRPPLGDVYAVDLRNRVQRVLLATTDETSKLVVVDHRLYVASGAARAILRVDL